MSISSSELRSKFLKFFADHGHQIVKSAPLLPKDDPTLLFVNAGMVQFKDVFTGKEKLSYSRAASSQKCVRAGGKHNDLENVGRTARHHTFFEMLGNFSFGDYFKKEACLFAWQFLTNELGLDPKKLYVTIFAGESGLPADDEAFAIWRDVVGVPEDHISKKGAEDNFWAMGDTGPCGPCTEIHYDRSDIKSAFGGDDQEGDRLIEIWNLVFMQYERKSDGTLIPLPKPCVDTGMGLERLCTVMNKLGSNYDTDLLAPMISETERMCGKGYAGSDAEDDISFRVIADHSRTTAFLMADGVLPGNEGRGYVLRRIMRRAIRYGARLGFAEPFFHHICERVIDSFAPVYGELEEARELIKKMVLMEETTFRKTLERGILLFEKETKKLTPGSALGGSTVFHLYETYGFPPDLTAVLAREHQLEINWTDFENAKAKHEQASTGELGLVGIKDIYKALHDRLGSSVFMGNHASNAKSRIIAIINSEAEVSTLTKGTKGEIILDKTPFYGESGGQVGDTGSIVNGNSKALVLDTKKYVNLNVHQVMVTDGELRIGDEVFAEIDVQRRENIRRHHSVTHLLHSALRQLLGTHVTQKGSLVDEYKTRFDFSHFEPLSKKQIVQIENLVNSWILGNEPSKVMQMSFDEAKGHGAMALFGEKYGNEVRVVEMGTHSTELCGGTHVEKTGDMGCFKIVSEGPLAAGVRRLEAVAGFVALERFRQTSNNLQQVASFLSCAAEEAPKRVSTLLQELRNAQREIDQLRQKDATKQAEEAMKLVKVVNGINIVAHEVQHQSPQELREYSDKIRNQLKSGIVVLGMVSSPQKATVLVAITNDLTSKYHAGNLVKILAEQIGGSGGGRADFAQAGGPLAEKIQIAVNKIYEIV